MNVACYLQQRQYGLRQKPGAKKYVEELLEKKFTDSFVNKPCAVSGRCRSTFVMQFSPDGTKMASTHGDHSIQVTDIATGRVVRTLTGHPRTPWTLAFHPSSSHILASGCLSGQVRIWDLYGHGCEVWDTDNSTVVASLTFHPTDNVLVIAAGNTLYFWDWSKPEPFTVCKTTYDYERIRWVKFDSQGNTMYTGICNSMSINREPLNVVPSGSEERPVGPSSRLSSMYNNIVSYYQEFQRDRLLSQTRPGMARGSHASRPPETVGSGIYDGFPPLSPGNPGADAVPLSEQFSQVEQDIRSNAMLFSTYALRLAQTERASAEQRFLGNRIMDGGQRGQGQGSSTFRYQRPNMQAVFGSPVSTNASLLNPLSDPIFASTSSAHEDQGHSLTSEFGQRPFSASAFESHDYGSGGESIGAIPSLEGEGVNVAADLQGIRDHSVPGAFMSSSQPYLAPPLRGVVSPPPFVNVPVTTDIEVNLEAFIQQSTVDVNRGLGSSVYSTTLPAVPRYSQYSQPSTGGANNASNSFPDINIEPSQAAASDSRGVGFNSRLVTPGRSSAIHLPPALSEQTGTLFLSQLQNMVPPTTSAASAPSMSRQTGSFHSIRDRLKSSVPLGPISSTKQDVGSKSQPTGIPKVTVIMNSEQCSSSASNSERLRLSLPFSAENDIPRVTVLTAARSDGMRSYPSYVNPSTGVGIRHNIGGTVNDDNCSTAHRHSVENSDININSAFNSNRTSHTHYVDTHSNSSNLIITNTSNTSTGLGQSTFAEQSQRVGLQTEPHARAHNNALGDLMENYSNSAPIVASTSSHRTLFENICHQSSTTTYSITSSSESVPATAYPHHVQRLPPPYNYLQRARYMPLMGPYLESRGHNPLTTYPSSTVLEESTHDIPAVHERSLAFLPSTLNSRDRASSESESEVSSHLSTADAYFLPITEDHGHLSSASSVNRSTNPVMPRGLSTSAGSSDSGGDQSSRTSSQGAQEIELVVDQNENYTTSQASSRNNNNNNNNNTSTQANQNISVRSNDDNNNSIHIVAHDNNASAVAVTAPSSVATSLEEHHREYVRLRNSFVSMTDQIEREMNELNRRISALRDTFNQSIRSLRHDRRRYETLDNLLPLDSSANLAIAEASMLDQPLIANVPHRGEVPSLQSVAAIHTQETVGVPENSAQPERYGTTIVLTGPSSARVRNPAFSGVTQPPSLYDRHGTTGGISGPPSSLERQGATSGINGPPSLLETSLRSHQRQMQASARLGNYARAYTGEANEEGYHWRTMQRHYIHPHYSSSILDDTVNRPNNAIQSAINRAIAGAFMGSGESAVANNIINHTHRIQAWDFRRCDIPDISQSSVNVVVTHCKLHNDASADIAQSDTVLATFVPSHQGFPDDNILAVYSLEPRTRGQCLYTKKFGPNAISVSISPCMNYVLVGLAAKRLSWVFSSHQMVAQIYKLETQKAGEKSMKHVKDVMHVCSSEVRNHVSGNSARWLPSAGQGLVYGTNKGDLNICVPGTKPVVGKSNSEDSEDQEGPEGRLQRLVREYTSSVSGRSDGRDRTTSGTQTSGVRRSAATQTAQEEH